MSDRTLTRWRENACRQRLVGNLLTTVEMLLLERVEEIRGDQPDPTLGELAYVYRRLTGFDALKETEDA